MPADIEWLVAKFDRRFVVLLPAEVVAEYVASMVEDDVEDHVKTARVGFVHETAKLLLGARKSLADVSRLGTRINADCFYCTKWFVPRSSP